MTLFNRFSKFYISSFIVLILSCTKMVEIEPPVNSITTKSAFADSVNANSAVLGIYSKIYNADQGGVNIFSGNLSILCAITADDVVPFTDEPEYVQLYTNSYNALNGLLASSLWSSTYFYIYQANACIEGLSNSKAISTSTKNHLLAESRFFRAFCYFYLINLFGDVPYVTTTNWELNSTLSRTSKETIYTHIIEELEAIKETAASNYSYSGNEKVRVNKWAILALLARVYLYHGDWDKASETATLLIDNSIDFSLVGDLNQVFLKNSPEAILQWQNLKGFNPYNATPEGLAIIPFDRESPPSYYLTTNLLNQFEAQDQRLINWVDTTIYENASYIFPYKYKIGYAERSPQEPITEYYSVFRLAEQYLIRSEARARIGDLAGAKEDLDKIRIRAGLSNTTATSQEEILNAIFSERRSELFGEWGHRWFDLKRTNRVNDVLLLVKGNNWQSTDELFPIPYAETANNPNLTQNPGY
jgi:starch-binding outer membrane protein, SusD/RagB family